MHSRQRYAAQVMGSMVDHLVKRTTATTRPTCLQQPLGSRGASARSPLNGSLLRRIDVLTNTALEEERRHVVGEKRPRLRIHHVEAVMVDQHRLLFQPVAPTLLADFLNYARTDFSRERWSFKAGAGLAAARAS